MIHSCTNETKITLIYLYLFIYYLGWCVVTGDGEQS